MKLLLILLLSITSLLASKLEVTTSIIPQKYFIQKIAKEKVIVNVMVKAGFSPSMYEPKTSQMRKLSNSKAYFSIGVPFENVWLDKFKSTNKKMLMVDTSLGIEKKQMQNHQHHDEHEKEELEDEKHKVEHNHANGLDPHIWLDPMLVKVQAKNILNALLLLDDENALFYIENYNVFITELENLNNEIKTILKDSTKKAFMVFHPSWNYFSSRYNLEQIAVEKEGKEPKPKEVAKLIEEAKEHNIKILFVSPQFSQKTAKIIAKNIKGNVIKIDPLSYEYDKNLLDTARAIKNSYE